MNNYLNSVYSPWIYSRRFDLTLILAPALVATLIALLLPTVFKDLKELPIYWWLILIVGVDVTHVYSTLYRTYFDRDEFARRPILLVSTPIFCWLIGTVLYSFNAALFWSVLAYVAVYHFIRQQYGFMMIYGRGEKQPWRWSKLIDKIVIYLATLYPVIYWHTRLPRNFVWFVEGDFISISSTWLATITGVFYLLILLLYVGKESYSIKNGYPLNIPKNLLLLGTAVSWYVGIVMFNGDLVFTLTNVVAHGIPYVALIWIYGRKKVLAQGDAVQSSWLKKIFSPRFAIFFVAIIATLALAEEAIWDATVWRDREALFSFLYWLPEATSKEVLIWLVPLLAMPQATHYVLDGFIWRMKKGDPGMERLLG